MVVPRVAAGGLAARRGADDGDTASEQDLYARERRAFINLCQTAETHARIASMLDDGAAIRN